MTSPHLTLLLFALLLAWPLQGEAAEEPAEVTQTIPRQCGICHLERITSSPGEGFNYLSLRRQEGAGESGMCYSCHNGTVRDSRRSIWTGFQHRADGRTPEIAPGRRASCGTCHDPHIQREKTKTFMRFSSSSFSHCRQCHPERRGERRGEHPSSGTGTKDGRGGVPSCGSCHRTHRAAARNLLRTSSADGLCDGCHGDNPSREGKGYGAASHPVGGKGPSCSSCHLVHGAPGENLSRNDLAGSALCLECHEASGGPGNEKGNHTIQPEEVECLSCHRVHNAASLAESGGLLAAEPSGLDTLCRKCHALPSGQKGEWNHPVGTAVGSTGGTRLSKLTGYGGILGPGRKIQCLTCHRSHNALEGTSNLVVNRRALCLYCHSAQNSLAPGTAQFGTHPISVQPRRATIAEPFLAAGGETGPGGEIICVTCHRAHHGHEGTAGLVLSSEDHDCTLCHIQEATIEETAHRYVGSAGEDGKEAGLCRGCHGNHGWNIDLEAAGMGGSVIEKVCWSCHGPNGGVPMSGFFGHIIGVPPSGGTGQRDLPLFWNDGRRLEQGVITCATCHDAHRDPAAHFLRIDAGETWSAICIECHRRQRVVKETKHDMSRHFPQEKNRRGEPASRSGPCGACHLVHSDIPGHSWAREIAFEPGQPGGLSNLCFDCHRKDSLAKGKIVAEEGHPSPEVRAERPETVIVDCNGCHDPHLWDALDPSRKGDFLSPGDGSNSFLVTPMGRRSQLCRKCHSDQFSLSGTTHDFSGGTGEEGLCGSCHLPHGGQELLMWPAPLPPESEYGSATCLSCHEKNDPASDSQDGDYTHPVGISPGSSTTEELPLYTASGRKHFRGKLSCGTCHDPHRWSPEKDPSGTEPAEAGPKTSFLRLPSDGFSPLCFSCHVDRSMVVGTDHDLRVTAPKSVNLDGLTAEESGVCGSCHRVHRAPHQLALWNRTLGAGEDPQSRYCRSCHDEGGLEEATVPSRPEAHLVAYPGKGMVSRLFTKRQVSILDTSSIFSLYSREGEKKNRGYISCNTCHDVHRWEPEVSRSGTGVPLEGDDKNSFLRIRTTFSIGQSFCRGCHGEDTLELYRTYHSSGESPPEEGQTSP